MGLGCRKKATHPLKKKTPPLFNKADFQIKIKSSLAAKIYIKILHLRSQNFHPDSMDLLFFTSLAQTVHVW